MGRTLMSFLAFFFLLSHFDCDIVHSAGNLQASLHILYQGSTTCKYACLRYLSFYMQME